LATVAGEDEISLLSPVELGAQTITGANKKAIRDTVKEVEFKRQGKAPGQGKKAAMQAEIDKVSGEVSSNTPAPVHHAPAPARAPPAPAPVSAPVPVPAPGASKQAPAKQAPAQKGTTTAKSPKTLGASLNQAPAPAPAPAAPAPAPVVPTPAPKEKLFVPGVTDEIASVVKREVNRALHKHIADEKQDIADKKQEKDQTKEAASKKRAATIKLARDQAAKEKYKNSAAGKASVEKAQKQAAESQRKATKAKQQAKQEQKEAESAVKAHFTKDGTVTPAPGPSAGAAQQKKNDDNAETRAAFSQGFKAARKTLDTWKDTPETHAGTAATTAAPGAPKIPADDVIAKKVEDAKRKGEAEAATEAATDSAAASANAPPPPPPEAPTEAAGPKP